MIFTTEIVMQQIYRIRLFLTYAMSYFFTGSHSECNNSKTENENRFNSETNSQEEEQPCTLLLTPPSSSGQDGENSNYSSISSHPNDTFTESNNVSLILICSNFIISGCTYRNFYQT